MYVMFAIVFLQGFVFYGPIATVYRQARGLSMYHIFVIESIALILMLLLEIPWGWFADRFGYKRTIVISNLIFFLSKIIFFKAYSFEMFLLERVFLSIAISGLSGCDVALLYSSIDEEQSEKVFGRYSAFSTAGFLLASFITTFIITSPITKVSMDRTSFFTIIPYGMAVIISLFIKDIKINKEENVNVRRSLKTALKNKQIILLVLSFALVREVFQAITVFLNQVQYFRSGIDIKYFGILIVVIQVVRLASAKSYKISNKFGKVRSIQVLFILITISCGILIFTTNPIFSVLCIVFISISMSLVEPMYVDIQNKSIYTGDRATILSIYAMIGDVLAAVINPAIGRAADISVINAFIVCVIISILACILLYIYGRTQKMKKLI
jgi:MFS family permease